MLEAIAVAFLRGAIPTPRHRLLAANPFHKTEPVPTQFAIVPQKLSYWGNNQYGDCVTAEEAFKCACDNPEDFIPDSEVIRWAKKHGVLEGAMLDEVMDAMKTDGLRVDPNEYRDGGKLGVDYSNEAVLQAAVAQGVVKIAIDADALPSGAGNDQGWYALGKGRHPNTDHCVALCGYGPAQWLYEQLKVPLPSGLLADQRGYLLYTWATIGFVDHAWLMGTCTEAWLRQPSTIIVGPEPQPLPPGPAPAPGPTPSPSPFWDFIWQMILSHQTEILAVVVALFKWLLNRAEKLQNEAAIRSPQKSEAARSGTEGKTA